MKNPFETWPFRWFGFWGAGETDQIVDLESWIDKAWAPEDRARLIQYLKDSPTAVVASAGYSPCLLCDHRLLTACVKSDDVWLWPCDLAHYVEAHQVRIPDAFRDHIRSAQFTPPATLHVRDEDLPWP